jgi:endonuclease YncB( thermonuclease family)
MECRIGWLTRIARRSWRLVSGPVGPFAVATAVVLAFALGQPERLMLPYRPEVGAHFACKLLRVLDGDTLDLDCPGGWTRVRLWGMDAPEQGQQPWGRQARQTLVALLQQPQVRLRVRDRDRYDRTVAQVFSPAGDVGLAMLRAGAASLRTRYVRDPVYRQAVAEARSGRLGIWSVPGWHQQPWVWRRYNPRERRAGAARRRTGRG